ncbi:ATP-binding protein [Teredinibacter turnerae]|uniref:ATP-binding protein n=1 Tax=Teredinibacter turnerae TaxID=2426 RepID=UPI00036CA60E|nr:ATP-binding protein [Teredinibacter turnerae]
MSTLKIKPYARLLTMLGEQLIKNERIALIELIKNCYDADATWVKITFENFGDKWEIQPDSKIIIEDNGDGMSENVIKNHFTSPATPEKKHRKTKKATTKKGRYIQGEKGIGRFAILKLGKKIIVTTKELRDKNEHKLVYDFTKYDQEFLTENDEKKEIFLSEISINYTKRSPVEIAKKPIQLGARKVNRSSKGTRIEISNLKGAWNSNKVENVFNDIVRLKPIFLFDEYNNKKVEEVARSNESDFNIYLYKDDERLNFSDDNEKLTTLIENNTALKYEEGHFSQNDNIFTYKKNGVDCELNLNKLKVKGRSDVKEHFGLKDENDEFIGLRKATCGDFKFGFYIFDFSNKATHSRIIDKSDKTLLKGHRIYLYRDFVRVYPYGEPEDDWLKIDMHRGTISAGDYLSNDQLVGYVLISHKDNPNLVDKTNREGLIESGQSLNDFQALLQIFLAYVRQVDYREYQAKFQDNSSPINIHNDNEVEKQLEKLKKQTEADEDVDPKKTKSELNKILKNYKTERNYLVRRAETTEELAGVGLSVETTSHDVMSMLEKAENKVHGLVKDCMAGDIDPDSIVNELQILSGQIGFVISQMKGIQSLFKSSRQRRKQIPIEEHVNKVVQIYRKILKTKKVDYQIFNVGTPLVASTTDAVLLQVLINLFDNAIYWLDVTNIKDRKIEITLDGDNGVLIFSDNGPGIDKQEAPYIFEPFVSGKGIEGRGLGLYIARQLLRRQDYDIDLADIKSYKKLPGANFVVTFVKDED